MNLDYATDDATAGRQSGFSLFMFKWPWTPKRARTPSAFVLARPSRAQYVVLGLAHLLATGQILISLLSLTLFWRNMASIFQKFKLFIAGSIWQQIRNLHPQISEIGLFSTIFDAYYYLPKFQRNLASMFVMRFVCLFVCLSVCCVGDTGRSFWRIITKLGTDMYPSPGNMPIVFLGQRSNN